MSQTTPDKMPNRVVVEYALWSHPPILLTANTATSLSSATPESLTKHWTIRAHAHLQEWAARHMVPPPPRPPRLKSITPIEYDDIESSPFDDTPDGAVAFGGKNPDRIAELLHATPASLITDSPKSTRPRRSDPDTLKVTLVSIPAVRTPWGTIPPFTDTFAEASDGPSARAQARAAWVSHVHRHFWEDNTGAGLVIEEAYQRLPWGTMVASGGRIRRGERIPPQAYSPTSTITDWIGPQPKLYSVPQIEIPSPIGRPIVIPAVSIVAMSPQNALAYWRPHAAAYGAENAAEARQRLPKGSWRTTAPDKHPLGIVDPSNLPDIPEPAPIPVPEPYRPEDDKPSVFGTVATARRGRPPGAKDMVKRVARGTAKDFKENRLRRLERQSAARRAASQGEPDEPRPGEMLMPDKEGKLHRVTVPAEPERPVSRTFSPEELEDL